MYLKFRQLALFGFLMFGIGIISGKMVMDHDWLVGSIAAVIYIIILPGWYLAIVNDVRRQRRGW